MFALPDGETGPRAGWVSYERQELIRPNEGAALVRETDSPTGLPRHDYEAPVFGIRPGVSDLHLGANDYPIAARAFEDLIARELPRLTTAIPPGELAIQ